MAELQTSRASPEEALTTGAHNALWSQAVLPASIARGGRAALFLAMSLLPAAGCVHVDKLELSTGEGPKPVPTSPETAESLPEGRHWEKPILTGYERTILVKHGELVEEGTRLVQYAERAIQSVEYEVRRAELSVEEHASVLDRLHKLESTRAVSQQELHAAITVLEQAKLSLEQAEIRLADLEVRAPFRGRVRIDATSNSPSISVYPAEESQALYFQHQGGASKRGE